MSSSNQGDSMYKPFIHARYIPYSQGRYENHVFGFPCQHKLEVAKVKKILLLSQEVTAVTHLNNVIQGMGYVSGSLTSQDKIFKKNSEVELAAKALAEKIERFRAELYREYLDLVSDPEFLVSAIELGDRVSVSDHSR